MPQTEAQKRARTKYMKTHYETFLVKFRKGEREKYKQFAASQGKGLNGLILELLKREMEGKK